MRGLGYMSQPMRAAIVNADSYANMVVALQKAEGWLGQESATC